MAVTCMATAIMKLEAARKNGFVRLSPDEAEAVLTMIECGRPDGVSRKHVVTPAQTKHVGRPRSTKGGAS